MKYLEKVAKEFPQTQIWNDSCSIEELKGAIAEGAVGATTNPVIVNSVIKNEWESIRELVASIIAESDSLVEDEIVWEIISSIGKEAAALLLPIYQESNSQLGRLSLQTNAKYYRDTEKMVEQAIQLCSTFENSQIKAPASEAGVKAFEEMTYQGLSINATVCFTVAQALAVAEAVERGLKRRELEGLSNENITPVCTIMVGRVDDALKEFVKENNLSVSEEALESAGIAIAKRVYQLYKERGYKTKLLVAAYRNVGHASAFAGGDLVLTIPRGWQNKINEANPELKETIDEQVSEALLEELMTLPAFTQAYEIDGLEPADFERYVAFQKTILQFLRGYDSLVDFIREQLILGDQ